MARELRNRLIYYLHDKPLLKEAQRVFHGTLLDIGCGSKPYQSPMKSLVTHHFGLDYRDHQEGLARPDMLGTAYQLPLRANSVDSILSTSALEHLSHPLDALCEAFRVLRPGGYAIYTAPFIWHLHDEPHDYFRFSKYGLTQLFRESGFETIQIRALSGFWGTFGQLFVYYLYRFNIGPIKWLHLMDVIGLFLQLAFYLLDALDRCEKWTCLYMVIAHKPYPDRKHDRS